MGAPRATPAATIVLVVLVVAYAATFTSLSILQYQTADRLTRDLGMFQQVFWNTLHGRPFQGTLFYAGQNFLASHFTPGLVVLLPFFALWPDPRLLLAVQSLSFGLAAVPVYLFGRDRLGSAWLAVLVAGVYLLQPALHYANLFEFHEISLATPLLPLAVWLAHRRPLPAWLLPAVLFLALTIKEDVSLTVAVLGFYLAVRLKRRRLGVALAVLGLAWAVVVVGFAMPALNSFDRNFLYVRQYAGLGETPGEIVWHVLTHPLELASRLMAPAKLGFLRDLLLPFGFLPLLSPWLVALAAPTLGYLMLSDDPAFATIRFHHPAPVLPLLTLAAVEGLARLAPQRRIRRPRGAATSLRIARPFWPILAVAAGSYLVGWGPFPGNLELSRFRAGDRAGPIEAILRQIPADAAVSASGNLIAQLASREQIAEFPRLAGARFVALDYRHVDAIEPGRVGPGEWAALQQIWRDDRWALVDGRDRLVLLERRPAPTPAPSLRRRLDLDFGGRLELVGYELPVGQSFRPGDELGLVLYWRALERLETNYVVSVQLFDPDGTQRWQSDAEAWGGVYPTGEWTPGRIVRDRRDVLLPSDLPAGSFRLLVIVYDRQTGRPLAVHGAGPLPRGDGALLGPIPVTAAPEPRPWPGDWRALGATLGGGQIELRRSWLDRPEAHPGDWLTVVLEWQARRSIPENYTLFVHLRDEQLRIWGQQDEPPGLGYQATRTWRPGDAVETVTALRIRPDTPPGRYSLDVGLYRLDTLERLPIEGNGQVTTQVTVAEVQVTE